MIGVIASFDYHQIRGGASVRIQSDLNALSHIGEHVDMIFPSHILGTNRHSQSGVTLTTYPGMQCFGYLPEKMIFMFDMHTQVFNPFFRLTLRKRYKRYSLIFAHFPWTTMATYSVTRKTIPLIYVAHNCEYRLVKQATGNRLAHKYIYLVERYACMKSQKILCVSARDKDNLQQTYEIPDDKFVVFPNTIDIEFLSQIPILFNKNDERRQLGFSPSSFIVLFPGRMDYRANSDALEFLLNEIVPALQRSTLDVKVIIAGAQIPKWCLTDQRVSSFSDVADMRRFFSVADLVVVPLLTGGGTRLKILESFAAKIPVVSTAKGAEGIECTDGYHISIANETAEDFVNKIEILAASENLRKTLTQNAYELVTRKYSTEATGRCLQRIIADIGTN